ncbi:MAG: EsaB/YukD family protein [Butyricicoccus sp.]|nr:EsaB/YukD family protein [Butyricicoccus sp.]
MKDSAVIIFSRRGKNKETAIDLEVPLDISANELVVALTNAYQLNIDTEDIKQCYLRCERPIALLRGDRTLREFGIRNGTIIHSDDQRE